MEYKNISKLLIVLTFIACVHSLVVIKGNTTREQAQKSVTYCYGCYASDNKVCMDGVCRCKTDYYLDPFSSTGICKYSSCSYDSKCWQSWDISRHCSSYGSCVCDTNYQEDWNNGRKCTYSYTYTYHTSAWAWVWIFFAIPAFIMIIGFLRYRRLHQARQHLVYSQTVQPPPYIQHQQQPGVTVYRY